MIDQHVGQLFKRWQPLPSKLQHPTLQVTKHRASVDVVPQSVQAFFEQVGFHDLPVQGEQLVQLLLFGIRQIDPARQEEPSLSFHHVPHGAALAEKLRSPYFVYCLIGVLHDVEFVVDDGTVRCPLLDAGLKRLPHVYAGRLDPLPLSCTQLDSKEFVQGIFLSLQTVPLRKLTKFVC